jgi:hypothetical protein
VNLHVVADLTALCLQAAASPASGSDRAHIRRLSSMCSPRATAVPPSSIVTTRAHALPHDPEDMPVSVSKHHELLRDVPQLEQTSPSEPRLSDVDRLSASGSSRKVMSLHHQQLGSPAREPMLHGHGSMLMADRQPPFGHAPGHLAHSPTRVRHLCYLFH